MHLTSVFYQPLETLYVVQQMLQFEPSKRISAKKAMEHPYFDDLNKASLWIGSSLDRKSSFDLVPEVLLQIVFACLKHTCPVKFVLGGRIVLDKMMIARLTSKTFKDHLICLLYSLWWALVGITLLKNTSGQNVNVAFLLHPFELSYIQIL